MKLYIKNIGKVKEADIKIDGITVIAGENDSGKSTLGRSLYAIFNSLHNIDERIRSERILAINGRVDYFMIESMDTLYSLSRRNKVENDSVDGLVEEIYEKFFSSEYFLEDIENIRLQMKEFLIESIATRDDFDEIFRFFEDREDELNDKIVKLSEKISDSLVELFEVSDEDFIQSILSQKFNEEFNRQVVNIFNEDDGNINLTIKNHVIEVRINKNNDVSDIKNIINIQEEPIYIDDPFILDKIRNLSLIENHSNSLINSLRTEKRFNTFEELIVGKKLEKIINTINRICPGEIIKDYRSVGYKIADKNKTIDLKNLSAGLKTFVILKTLLLNGTIGENGTIILDEPEIHLHPEWQLLLAELIVLIQKEFSLHILITTHSPYFLGAIEAYSYKHETMGKCNYYLASNNGEVSEFEDVTEDIEKIYAKLARPLQDLENIRYSEHE